MWVNEYEAATLLNNARFEEKPYATDGAMILDRLIEWTNTHSDGWPYWQKPARAADRLIVLLYENDRKNDGEDITAADLRKALTPIKAFITKQIAGGGSNESDRLWILEGKTPAEVV